MFRRGVVSRYFLLGWQLSREDLGRYNFKPPLPPRPYRLCGTLLLRRLHPFLEIFPILTISGPTGTGKTTLLDVLRQISFEPPAQFINGGIVSRAVLRDSFGAQPTALIDEGDEIPEDLLMARYSRRSSAIEVNRVHSEGGYRPRTTDVFGATAIHRRDPYKDPATLSRSIVIATKSSIVCGFSAKEFVRFAPIVERIAKRVDWKRAPELGTGRISDTWAPLLLIHQLFGGDWGEYAAQHMKSANDNLGEGHETEPRQAVYKSLLSLVMNDSGEVAERVLMGSVAKNLSDDESLSSYQVGQVPRDLGFSKHNRGGNIYIYSGGREKLTKVAQELGIEDELLGEDDSMKI